MPHRIYRAHTPHDFTIAIRHDGIDYWWSTLEPRARLESFIEIITSLRDIFNFDILPSSKVAPADVDGDNIFTQA